ncbi:MAG: asparagine synthetase B family protein, partial [Myxococcales bacterium]|nr:asparagine synthetase B family protein [Myxococcales bacterium]
FAAAPEGSDEQILVRDRFGIKPLFYTEWANRLWFADHPLPLLHLIPDPAPRTAALLEWLHYGLPLQPETFFEAIRMVPAGCRLRSQRDSGPVIIEPYFDLVDSISPELSRSFVELPAADAQTRLEALLNDAVLQSIGQSSSVTTLLSGGVDSSILTALAARHAEVDAVTIDVQGPGATSELRFAEMVARHVGARHVACTLDAESYRNSFCGAIRASATPSIVESSVALHHAAASGCLPAGAPIIDGEGADALFGGSPGLFKLDLFGHLLSRTLHVGESRVATAFDSFRRQLNRIGLHNRTPMEPLGLDWALGVRGAERLMRREKLREASAHLGGVFATRIGAAMLDDFDAHLALLVARLDPMARLVDATVELPFVEHSLLEFGLNLPLHLKFRLRRGRPDTKWVLKELASRLVPPAAVWRPKGGFEIPGEAWTGSLPKSWKEDSWVASQFRMNRETLDWYLDSTGPSRNRMFLVGMEVWGRLFALREPFEQVQQQWLASAAEP